MHLVCVRPSIQRSINKKTLQLKSLYLQGTMHRNKKGQKQHKKECRHRWLYFYFIFSFPYFEHSVWSCSVPSLAEAATPAPSALTTRQRKLDRLSVPLGSLGKADILSLRGTKRGHSCCLSTAAPSTHTPDTFIFPHWFLKSSFWPDFAENQLSNTYASHP